MKQGPQGFTLIEVLMAMPIAMLVLASVVITFLWGLSSASDTSQHAWVQREALESSQKLSAQLRHGVWIYAIDVNGNWVEVVMPDPNAVGNGATGKICRVSYENPTPGSGDGRLTYVDDVSDPSCPTQVVAVSATKVQTLPARNVFHRAGPDLLRIAYRIGSVDDTRAISAEVDFGVRLRNH